jgi:hypothetical protein
VCNRRQRNETEMVSYTVVKDDSWRREERQQVPFELERRFEKPVWTRQALRVQTN